MLEGRDVTEEPPYSRNLGVVFQSLALFPHMDVFSNVAFPLRMRSVGRAEIAKRVRTALEIVRLPQVEGRNVRDLSGGQRQRIALARALVYEPPLLLLDEPLGALDRRLREDMQIELMRLHRELDVTIVNVTHDQREALMLSDRIGIMQEGEIVQVATPEELYRDPATVFVASFLGDPVLIAGEVVADAGGRCSRPVGCASRSPTRATRAGHARAPQRERHGHEAAPPTERSRIASRHASSSRRSRAAAPTTRRDQRRHHGQGGGPGRAEATLGIGAAGVAGWNAADAPVLPKGTDPTSVTAS